MKNFKVLKFENDYIEGSPEWNKLIDVHCLTDKVGDVVSVEDMAKYHGLEASYWDDMAQLVLDGYIEEILI